MMMMIGSSCRCAVALGVLRERHRLQNYSMAAPLLLTSGLVRCEIVLHGCGTSPVCLFVYFVPYEQYFSYIMAVV